MTRNAPAIASLLALMLVTPLSARADAAPRPAERAPSAPVGMFAAPAPGTAAIRADAEVTELSDDALDGVRGQGVWRRIVKTIIRTYSWTFGILTSVTTTGTVEEQIVSDEWDEDRTDVFVEQIDVTEELDETGSVVHSGYITTGLVLTESF